MSRVVIIGAGASIDASEGELPSATNFFEKIRTHRVLDSYLKHDSTISLLKKLISPDLDLSISPKAIDKINIENIFTLASLELEIDPSDKSLWELTELIRKAILTFSDFEEKKGNNYQEFVKDFLDGSTSVVSYNWDTLLDKELPGYIEPGATGTLESIYWEYMSVCTAETLNTYKGQGIPTPTEQVTPKAAYLKLHGSADTVFCKNTHCRTYMMPFRTKNAASDHYCGACYEKVVPYLIPPVQNKPIRNFPYIRRSWMLASQLIYRAEEVVIWGYSLPETDHWSRWLINHIWKEGASCKKLIIINPEVASYSRIKKVKIKRGNFVSKFKPQIPELSKVEINLYELYDLYKKGEEIY
jgi:hypothetical protein